MHFEDVSTFFDTFLPHGVNYVDGYMQTPGRVDNLFAIGDIHGDLLSLLTCLFEVGIIDTDCKYIPSTTSRIFLQCGDLMDRKNRTQSGTNSSRNEREEIDIIQFLFGLDKHAQIVDHGRTRVLSLCGNHDLYQFNFRRYEHMRGRYTTKLTDMGFGGQESRFRIFQRGPHSGAAHYMKTRPIILRIDDYICVHAGLDFALLPPHRHASIVNDLNTEYITLMLSQEMGISDTLDSIVHFRKQGTAMRQDSLCGQDMKTQMVSVFGIDLNNREDGGLIVGHSVQEQEGINAGCFMGGRSSGTVWRVDVGLSEAFGRKHENMYPT